MRFLVIKRPTFIHLAGSALIALLVSVAVLWSWYPGAYTQVSGGLHLLSLVIAVDVICGPLLTQILVKPHKSSREILLDVVVVVFIQLAALAYGLMQIYQARPLYLVHEIDRFRLIAQPDYLGVDVAEEFRQLAPELRVGWCCGPKVVGARMPENENERQKILFEALAGGRDLSQRPSHYVAYGENYRTTVLARAKSVRALLAHYPSLETDVSAVLVRNRVAENEARFVPLQHKEDWVVIVDQRARVLGFLRADGFQVIDRLQQR